MFVRSRVLWLRPAHSTTALYVRAFGRPSSFCTSIEFIHLVIRKITQPCFARQVTFDLTKDCGMVVQRQAIFAVLTVVPAPGVDIWRAFESVCREHPCATVRDERLMLFAKVNHVCPHVDVPEPRYVMNHL